MYLKSEVLVDLKNTLEHIDLIKKCDSNNFKLGYKKCFERIDGVYPFTNESMMEYNKLLDLNNKNILTVTASGDQAIIAMLKGAKQIDTFDCNKLTYYHLFFKIAAIEALTYQEFIDLYNIDLSNYSKDPTIHYKKLRDAINKEDIKIFWDNFFNLSKFQASQNFKLFFLGGCSISDFKDIDYLEEDKYLQTKKMIHNNLTFNNIDVLELAKVYKNNKYSFINLSNIIDYVADLDKYIELIKSLINNNLEDDGAILAAYDWFTTERIEFDMLEKENCNPSLIELEREIMPLKGLIIEGNTSIDQNQKIIEKNSLILCKKGV